MKKILAIAAVFSVMAGSFAQAAPLVSSVKSLSNPQVFSVYVNGDTLNGGFDTIIFSAIPTVGTQFSSVNTGGPAAPRTAGDPSTFINRMLDADPAEIPGGLGFTRLGVTNTADMIGFTAGPIGASITTPAAPGLFLANFLLPPGNIGAATVQLVTAGNVNFQATIPIGIPEPASVGLVGIAMLGLAAARRRFA
jgi:hypothetical protein